MLDTGSLEADHIVAWFEESGCNSNFRGLCAWSLKHIGARLLHTPSGGLGIY